jgi:hypothetical protein
MPPNNELQRTKQGSVGASPLNSVFGGLPGRDEAGMKGGV